MSLLEVVMRERIIAIIRGIAAKDADQTAAALHDAGIKLLEVTTNTENASGLVSGWREKYDGSMAIGMGTVLNLQMAKEAVAAGAQFLISPNLDEAVVAYGLERGVDVWPGVMTPTEIVRAWNAGAKAVKLFPMASLGIGYLKEIRAPLDGIPMIVTGGVNLNNIGEFLAAGAVGVGLGSNLVDKTLVREGRFDEIRQRAEQYVAAATSASAGGAGA